MSPDRRSFLKNILYCSAGIALGQAAYGRKVLAGTPFLPFSRNLNSEIPVFPFFAYAARYNIGDYIPKDQGGKFIQEAIMGSEDDYKIVEAVRAGILEKTYGSPISWTRYEKTELEKSVWLNRFYYLPSFARLYYITGDKSFLEDMMVIIREWVDSNPLLPDSPKTTYNWRDMQVAWRTIHLSWCYYLGEKGLPAEDREMIKALQEKHSKLLLAGFGQQPLNEFNHQAHGALAMLYSGILFPSSEYSSALIGKGLEIFNHHLNKAFYEDGGNVEQMFGYYPFEMHIFRDAYLLCSANGITPPENSIAALRKMADYLLTISRPDGTVPEVNDSFPMPVEPSYDIINNILRQERQTPSSRFLEYSQVAVIRSKDPAKWYLLANPASVIGGHAHAGRLGFELWYKEKPVIIDSGCCNYDNNALIRWFRTSEAHNTVLIDGQSDKATSSPEAWAPRRETENKIVLWKETDDITSLVMMSPSDEPTNAGVKWTRTISMVKESFFIISDYFETDREHKYELLFHFPSKGVIQNPEDNSLTINNTDPVELIPAAISFKHGLTLSDDMRSDAGGINMASVAGYSFSAGKNTESHLIIAPVTGRSKCSVKVKRLRESSVITIKSGGRRAYRLSVNSKEIKLV